MNLIIEPGTSKLLRTPSNFLILIDASADVSISDASDNPTFTHLTMRAGWSYDTASVQSVYMHNDNDVDVTVNYQIAPNRMFGMAENETTIKNEIVVSEIKKSIQVEAQSTVENGSVSVLPHEYMQYHTISISSGQQQLVAARTARRRSLKISVSGVGSVTVNGLPLSSNTLQSDAVELDYSGELVVNHVSGTVNVAALEMWRN